MKIQLLFWCALLGIALAGCEMLLSDLSQSSGLGAPGASSPPTRAPDPRAENGEQVSRDASAPSPTLPPWGPLPRSGARDSSGHSGAVLAVHVQPVDSHAEQLLSVGADGAVIAWDLVRGDGSEVLRLPGPLSLAAFGATHAVIASAVGTSITVRCFAPCTEQWNLNRLKIRATALAFHDRDSALLIAGSDGRVYRWRFIAEREARSFSEQERTLERYAAHQSVVSAVAAHPFERAFFSGDWNGALFGWLPYTADAHGGRYDRNLFGARFYADKATFVKALRTPDRGISCLSVADSGEHLALGTEDGYVEVWNVKGFELSARRLIHTGRVLGVGLDTSGRWVASAGRDGVVAINTAEPDPQYGIAADALRMKLTPILSQPIERAAGVRFLNNGNVLVTTSAGSIAEVGDFSRSPPLITATPTAAPKPRDQDYG